MACSVVFPTPNLAAMILSVATATLLLKSVVVAVAAAGQSCGCSPDIWSSKHGYCSSGQTSGVLVVICEQGACEAPPPTSTSSGGTVVAEIVTAEFFNSIIDQADESCPGKKFYSRDAFLDSITSFPTFGTQNDSRQEIAAFFAHVTGVTGHFCVIDDPSGNYCDESFTQYPCTPGKKYYSRGPIQLTWNYNYGAAGSSIGFDGLNSPETVATDPVVSFKTALWFWMTNAHDGITSGQGFGATIRAMNGGSECNGVDPATVTTRVQYYKSYCRQLGVQPGGNLTC